MEGEGWRVIGGGVMLGTNPDEKKSPTRPKHNRNRDLIARSGRKRVPPSIQISAPPASLPAEPLSHERQLEESAEGESEDEASLQTVQSEFPLLEAVNVIRRPKSTPPISLSMSSFSHVQNLFVCAEA